MQDFNPQNLRYAKLVDRYARYIESPVLRLKFLNSALKLEPPDGLLMKLPMIGSLPERAMLILELSKVLPLDQPAPIGIRITSLLYRVRFAVYAASVAVVLTAGAGLVYFGSKVANSLFISTEAKGTAAEAQPVSPAANGGEAVRAIGSEAGLTLDKVWLAERGDGYEFYSNGARVLTEYETSGARRSFYRFNLDALEGDSGEAELLTRPVGILYHVSESDQLPFDDTHNSSLQNHSKSLLEFARAHKLYNYVIDRFGRTYRVVRDEDAASHAGNSVWGAARAAYVSLSASFIGICFEGKSGRGAAIGADGINEAQIYAARVLTAVLRSKYEIDDANCVTHGLVSVNPSNRLMGYHTDWVTAFPFDALGLSNKYDTEMIAISRLGFGYDGAYIRAAGGARWEGLARADAALRESASESGLSVEEKRNALSKIFMRAAQMQHALEKEAMRGGG
ncbi:MAG: N-acetylmuramoyl-L-alanine amidase [Blastocatellia bacterium]